MLWIVLLVIVSFAAGAVTRPYLNLPFVPFTDPRDEVADE